MISAAGCEACSQHPASPAATEARLAPRPRLFNTLRPQFIIHTHHFRFRFHLLETQSIRRSSRCIRPHIGICGVRCAGDAPPTARRAARCPAALLVRLTTRSTCPRRRSSMRLRLTTTSKISFKVRLILQGLAAAWDDRREKRDADDASRQKRALQQALLRPRQERKKRTPAATPCTTDAKYHP